MWGGGKGRRCWQLAVLPRVRSRRSWSAVSDAEDKASGMRNEELLPLATFIEIPLTGLYC